MVGQHRTAVKLYVQVLSDVSETANHSEEQMRAIVRAPLLDFSDQEVRTGA